MTDAALPPRAQPPVLSLLRRARGVLDAIPYAALAMIARAATFDVFFRSGLTKISEWNATIALFRDEYHVPVLPPELAARMATCLELGVSSLVLVGLFTRAGVLALLGMVVVIQTFVYPQAWPDHLQWLAFMAVLAARGPGVVSLDALLGRLEHYWLRRTRSS
jgi:putative oxidoreductase